MYKIFFKIIILFLSINLVNSQPQQVKIGADLFLEEKINLIDGKNIGIITNHTAVLSDGKHLINALSEYSNFKILALFGPEHGISGSAIAGEKISNSTDEKTGFKIFSLYGETLKPTPEMLNGIDVLIFDIQDVGARFYTYLSTLLLSMEAASENNIKFILLDRPNPIRGIVVDGPIRIDSLKSFVGWPPIPIMHGMTFGEIAKMANDKNWISGKVDLEIIPISGWKRSIWYDETNLKWIAPSPNIKNINSAIVYPGACLIEGTNLNEGRGTENPFEIIGAPWLKSKEIINNLIKLNLRGVNFEFVNYTPIENNGSKNPRFKGENCNGIFINVLDRNLFEPIKTTIAILVEIKKMHPNEFIINEKFFDKLIGNKNTKNDILSGKSYKQIVNNWQKDVAKFKKDRKKYLIYTE